MSCKGHGLRGVTQKKTYETLSLYGITRMNAIRIKKMDSELSTFPVYLQKSGRTEWLCLTEARLLITSMRKDITLTSSRTSAILLGNWYTNALEQGSEIIAQNHPTVQEDRLVYQLDGQTQQITLDTS